MTDVRSNTATNALIACNNWAPQETESHGFWCATRHLSVFAILEVRVGPAVGRYRHSREADPNHFVTFAGQEAPLTVVTQAPDGITGSLQNAVGDSAVSFCAIPRVS